MSDNLDRIAPLNWVIVSNDGTNLVANNTVTGETFSGTSEDFNEIIMQDPNEFDRGEAAGVYLVNPAPNVAPPGAFGVPSYDEVEITYDNEEIDTVTYKAEGEVVAAISLTYTNGFLTSVVRV